MAFTQQNRSLRISTPLGPDAVILTALRGEEAVSSLFHFDAVMVAEGQDLSFDAIVGKNVTVVLEAPGAAKRYLNGYVSHFAHVPRHGDFQEYRAEIVPWTWFLTQTRDCRIFQDLSVPDIVQKIFGEYAFAEYLLKLQRSYAPREYCVQYRETDLAFVARLLEEEGICYFFTHEDGKHTLVLADGSSGWATATNDRVEFQTQVDQSPAPDTMQGFAKQQALRPGKHTLRDYNFERPAVDLTSNATGAAGRDFEVFEYPGGYATQADGDQRATTMQAAEDATRTLFRGASQHRGLVPGHRFDLSKHPVSDGSYVVLRARHEALEPWGPAGTESDGTPTYSSDLDCITVETTFRPARRTPRPVVQGVQSGVVVGPEGEEIFTDQYGRVKVKFVWDREGRANEKSSCWIRVSQNWAGKRFGTIFLPRIGQEVLVDFLDGDPDRPIVIGRVYNAVNMPPYELPANQTRSTMKSLSSKGGKGFNEIRFEDKAGDEQLFINAERDFDLRVGNDRREWIERDHHLVAKRDSIEQIDRNAHLVVKQGRTTRVGGDDNLSVTGYQAIHVKGAQSLKVDGEQTESVQGHSLTASQSIYVNAGMRIVIEAGAQITLKAGGNFIDIGPAGVAIQGTMVLINSGGAPGAGVAGSLISPAMPLVAMIADLAEPGANAETFRTQRDNQSADEKTMADATSHRPDDPANKDKTHFVEVELVDDAGKPVTGERVRVTLPDGKTISERSTNEKGLVRIDNIDPGSCKITFPDIDDKAWE